LRLGCLQTADASCVSRVRLRRPSAWFRQLSWLNSLLADRNLVRPVRPVRPRSGGLLKIRHIPPVAGRRAAILASMCRAPKDSRACNWLCARQRSRMLSTPASPNFAQGSTWSSSSKARASHRRPSGDRNEHLASSRRYTARLTAVGTRRLRRLRFSKPAATRATRELRRITTRVVDRTARSRFNFRVRARAAATLTTCANASTARL
jgi:hypothetical protein